MLSKSVFFSGLSLGLCGLLLTHVSRGPGPRPASPLPAFEGSGALAGRPWIAEFIFTECSGPCPVLTGKMRELEADLTARVGLATFTVDPANDSSAKLEEYTRRFGRSTPRWRLFRLNHKRLYDLMYGGFGLPVAPDAKSGQVIHSTRFVLVDAGGFVRGYYDPLETSEFERLKRDARTLARSGS